MSERFRAYGVSMLEKLQWVDEDVPFVRLLRRLCGLKRRGEWLSVN